MHDTIQIGNNQIDKHEKYKKKYGKNDLYWGLGIENEVYLEFEKREEISKKVFLENHKSERYSVNYYENYKTSLEIYLKKHNKELITFDDIIDYKDKKNFSPNGPHGSIEFNKIVEKKINNALNLTDDY
jgi:hypothetical protein